MKSSKYDKEYMERLAQVYLDKHELHGHAAAKAWFKTFLNDELRQEIKPYISDEIVRRNTKDV